MEHMIGLCLIKKEVIGMEFEKEMEEGEREEIYTPKPVEFEEEVTGEALLLKEIQAMSEDAKEELQERLLDVITEEMVDMSKSEVTAVMRMMNGHYTRHILKHALDVSKRADAEATREIIEQFSG
jgi:hypothetical protein